MCRVKPILFNTDMVRAILDGRKTSTRRLIKYGFHDVYGYACLHDMWYEGRGNVLTPEMIEGYARAREMPYQPGDILYVRETWMPFRCEMCESDVVYCMNCNHPDFEYKADYDEDTLKELVESKYKWRPSIHMPKEAARIFLRVIDVRVERLQDMKWYDFISEGVCIRPEAFNDPENAYGQAKEFFVKIWDSTLKKADKDKYSWDANPWVWGIDFERCEKPERE